MLFRLAVPALDANAAHVTVQAWDLAEGDTIEFGQQVCSLRISKIQRQGRTRTASSTLGEPARDGVVLLDADLEVIVRASDSGVLRRIDLRAGEPVETGSSLGLVGSDADEPLDADPTLDFRLIAETVRATQLADDPLTGGL